ncbi:uncharacterized protein L969DRAFT_90346 [Mixia osmundae IAM 14324]|uniref:Magnesium transporter NIPA n=1 Tax=Mixia osmundae (strain CBS 9802 / IAM 14324 / JCM 22182 / KY 12970) TaxID=764103 RepID=G7E283_MIXOS|nr:uncharacterized protein L969DRAFT_90346 [Mixia osmundae IAM 14324]KEI36815.1 hypothetical protein L969DRAFT_90346 [Mixia osmundae IAM 14324]GAA96943.1 hypothetical protein E5Q_03617 [Mixia osmundae IAM 14324]
MFEEDAHISVAVGVIVGLLASFVQSLGLTIQRKSHLQNEAAALEARKKDWRRPLWITGFTIFFTSNILGSIFQLGALPIVVLAPLGAISLLSNAVFSRILLGDHFSRFLVVGTILIAGGAALIAVFGILPEPSHTLDELVRLYARPAFLIWIGLLGLSVIILALFSHWMEYRLERELLKTYILQGTHACKSPHGSPTRLRFSHGHSHSHTRPRRWSAPVLSQAIPRNALHFDPIPAPAPRKKEDATSIDTTEQGTSDSATVTAGSAVMDTSSSVEKQEPAGMVWLARRRLLVGCAYGSVSGTLSGFCLLFAKTGVDLLFLTVLGQNQFTKGATWLIVLALLFTALCQLAYLNKSLRLVSPTLVMPLSFCFFNVSSILNGLIYYDQWNQMTILQLLLVLLGVIVLLTGVWIVSLKSGQSDPARPEEQPLLPNDTTQDNEVSDAGWSYDEQSDDSTKEGLARRIAQFYDSLMNDEAPVRGLSIGIGASSPGFALRPQERRRHLRSASLSSSMRASQSHESALTDDNLAISIDSLDEGPDASDLNIRRRHTVADPPVWRPTRRRHARRSLFGPFVGAPDLKEETSLHMTDDEVAGDDDDPDRSSRRRVRWSATLGDLVLGQPRSPPPQPPPPPV